LNNGRRFLNIFFIVSPWWWYLKIASACWELFCLEHNIKADGTMCFQGNNDDDNSNAFFSSCYCNSTKVFKAIPRVVLIDLEPIPIDEIRTGCYRDLFDPSTLLTGKEDAASNFARGYNSLGCEMIDVALDRIRRVAENCECLQGFLTFRSVGGGSGSGFGSLLQERLTEEYCKSSRHEFNIFPSPR
jgi:tubulin alpha